MRPSAKRGKVTRSRSRPRGAPQPLSRSQSRSRSRSVPHPRMPALEHDPALPPPIAGYDPALPAVKREVKSSPSSRASSRASSISAVMASRARSRSRLSDGSEAMYHDDMGYVPPQRSSSWDWPDSSRSRSRSRSRLSDGSEAMYHDAMSYASPARASRRRARSATPVRAAVAAGGRSPSRDIVMHAADLIQGPVGVVNVLNDIIHGRSKRAWRRSVGFLTDKLYRLRLMFGRPFTRRRK